MARPGRHDARVVLRTAAVVISAALASLGTVAVGEELQQGEPQDEQEPQQEQPRFEEEIQVTGSLIPRPTLESLSPVTVLESKEIAATGLTRIEDLLITLPQVYVAQNATWSNGATGTASVDLRFMGAGRTLVLVNGRRMPTGDVRGPWADLNFIPVALVKRVDVLTGGAASVYGADAVAGVVNFILDTELEGFRGGIEYGALQHDNRNQLAQEINAAQGFAYPTGSTWDGDTVSANLAFGGRFGDGRGHATVYLDFRHIEPITKDQRDYSNCSMQASIWGPYCGGSYATPSGNFLVGDQGGYDWMLYALDPATEELVPWSGQLYNYSPLNHLQRPDRRWLAGSFIKYTFSRHVEGYAEVMFMDDFTKAQVAPSADFGSTGLLNCDNPMLSEQQRDLLCTQWGYGPHDDAIVIVYRRSVESGPRYDALRHTAWRLLAGVRGDIDEQWSYDLYGLHAEVEIAESYHNDLSVERLQDALLVVGEPEDPETWRCRSGNPGCAPWNIFRVGGVTQAAVDYIRTAAQSDGSTTTEILDGKLVGDLGSYGWKLPTAAESIRIALGAAHRKEGLTFEPDEVTRTGDAAGFEGPRPPVDGTYSVRELYLEAVLPIVQESPWAQDLSLELGYRYSKYNLSGSHPTSKVQLSYAPSRDLRFRAGVAHATRAPNVVELFTPQSLGVGGSDICANDPDTGVPSATLEECVRTGVRPEQYGHIIPNPLDYSNTLLGGNPSLEPERGDTRTFGIVLTPQGIPGLTAALDYFDITMEDTIGSLGADTILTSCARTGDPRICGLIHRDGSGSLWLTPDGYVVTTPVNIGTLATRGIDVNGSYLLRAGRAGFLDLNLVGTWLLEGSVATPVIGFDCVGYFGNSCSVPNPRWQHRASVSWETVFDTVFSLGWRYLGAATIDSASPDPDLADPDLVGVWKASGIYRLDAYNYFDLSATYTFAKGIQVRVGVNNILDTEPPLGPGIRDVDGGAGFFGTYDPWGRFIHASMQFNF